MAEIRLPLSEDQMDTLVKAVEIAEAETVGRDHEAFRRLADHIAVYLEGDGHAE